MNQASAGFIKTLMSLHQDSIPGRWPEKTKHLAPHKPLLVMAVLDEFAENPSRARTIEPSAQLEARFERYWTKVMGPSSRTTMALPFYHLKNDGFWTLIPWQEKVSVIEGSSDKLRKSTAALRELVRCAEINESLLQFLSDINWSRHLRSVIIATYFAPELHARLLMPA